VPNWLDLNSDGDVFTDLAEGPGFLAGNPTPGYLNPNDPCGDTNCSTDPGPMQESCEICPTDCGPCE